MLPTVKRQNLLWQMMEVDLISPYQHFYRVKDEVMQNNIVQLEMTWALTSLDDRVEYDLWFLFHIYLIFYFL